MAAMGLLGIGLGIATLILMAFRGVGMVPTTIVASLVVIAFNGMDLWGTFLDGYGATTANYVATYLVLFFLGTLFGELLSKSNAAKSIALQVLRIPLKRKALLVVVLAAAILSYGGVNLFVTVFSIYPIALVLFKQEDLPKRLFPAALFLGCATFTMVSLPGTPAIQNLIPAETFGTTAYAAPVMGIICSLVMAALGMLWLRYSQNRLAAKGVGFVPGSRDDLGKIDISDRSDVPNFFLSILPIALVVGMIFGLNHLMDTIFVVNIALAAGVLLTSLIFWPTLRREYTERLNTAGHDGLVALMNTAVVVGFGGVVAASVGFDTIVDWTMSLDMNPLISGAIAVGVVSAATGSASGGLQVFSDSLGSQYVDLARADGISLDAMHRVLAMSAAGLDSMPYSGGYITAITYTQLTHRESYGYFFVTNIVITSIGALVGIFLYLVLGIA
jgi:H+/gluconate symporter-like permease